MVGVAKWRGDADNARELLSELHLVSFVVVTEETSSLCLLTP